MITKEATYKKAFENIRQNRKEREAKRELLLNSLYSSNERLSEIDRELSFIGANIAIAALSNGKSGVEDLKKKSEALTAEKKLILEKAQIPSLQYDCELCKDTGYVSGKICECIKREAASIMTKELSRQMPLEDCRFDNFDLKYYPDKDDLDGQNSRRRMTAILKLCKEYVIGFNTNVSPNLLFMGDAGLGKTHLTLAIVSGVIEKGYIPVYASAENLFSAIESEKFSGEGRGSYESVLNSDLLVIDDLGTEMATTFTKSVLYNIINTRMLSRKPTIINTNLTMKQIEEKYTSRVSSRLIGSYDGYKFIGKDIRQLKRLQKNI